MTTAIPCDALVIGAGPAGLMAAEVLAAAGRRVIVAEAKQTPARKFLMAGKSGLNLTRDQPLADFARHYDADWLAPILDDFGPRAVMAWAEGLGIRLFTGSTGRVFPVGMKASPLLRAWLARLSAAGADLRTRWHWQGWQEGAAEFATPAGTTRLRPEVTVLALGGASWPRLGSDAAWVPWLRAAGVGISDFAPANMGFSVHWSDAMSRHFGNPVKGAALIAGGRRDRGEFVITARGLEGGGIYTLSRALRQGAPLCIDLLPDLPVDTVAARLSAGRAGETLSNRLRKTLRLDPVRLALAREWGGPLPDDPARLAERLKNLPARLAGPRPIAEAISSAGGITRAALSDGLELRAVPGVFAAGEMLDWEAPTGGYLLTACLATGRWAGRAAAGR